MASACLPTLYRAVEIDGDAYWDGGFSGNPTITPLVTECEAQDVVLVQINPVSRPDVPMDARDIQSRINEVSFNATLLKELRMMALLRRVVDPARGARSGADADAPHLHRPHGRARRLLQAQRRMGVPHDAARRGAPRGRATSPPVTAPISASARRSTSTSSSRGPEGWAFSASSSRSRR
jgi:predicted acylesterase/phospholipase RssA